MSNGLHGDGEVGWLLLSGRQFSQVVAGDLELAWGRLPAQEA